MGARVSSRPALAATATATAIAAAALPSLLAYNVSPSPTFLNQALAFALWGAFVLAAAPASALRAVGPVLAALGLMAVAAAVSWGPGALPASLGLSSIATLAAAAVLLAAGAGSRSRTSAEELFVAFCWAWVAAGVLNIAVGAVQVFTPGLPDGDWIAHSGYPGRAVGNLRQPNHLSSLLLWHCIAVVALFELKRLGRVAAALLGALGVLAVVLTASRTGLVSVLLLALWGLADRKLSRPARALLIAAPLVYLVSWLGMAEWAKLTQAAFGGSERLAESDISSSRFGIWRDTLVLIRQQPWAGVGWGEFNFAWSLTPSPTRPTALFDHTHNLPLQLVVELGLPLSLAIMAPLVWGLARGARRAWAAPAALGRVQRSAMVMVLMIGLHSLLEYPLWYSYFLLPAAWAWGCALQGEPEPESERGPAAETKPAPSSTPLSVAALAVVAVAALSVLDYTRVAAIFSASPGAPPLEQRIATGQHSIFFAHHADYAAVTSSAPGDDTPNAFRRATHYLLDARLMIAWAQDLASHGQVDLARHLAARLREFRKPDADEFFAPCPKEAVPAAPGLPFQCELPQQPHDWREFLSR